RSPGAGAGLSPSGSGAGFFVSPPSSHATPARRTSSCNAPSPSAPSSSTHFAPSRASELRRSEPEHLASPCKRAETERTVDGRAPLVASFLESAHARRREMLCAPPDQPLVRVQAAACAPQNHQYQTSATMCRIRVQDSRVDLGDRGEHPGGKLGFNRVLRSWHC